MGGRERGIGEGGEGRWGGKEREKAEGRRYTSSNSGYFSVLFFLFLLFILTTGSSLAHTFCTNASHNYSYTVNPFFSWSFYFLEFYEQLNNAKIIISMRTSKNCICML